MVIFSFLHWNPNREIFIIPWVNFPILWYSVFFAFGFFIGYYIFFRFLRRYLLNFPALKREDIKNFDLLISLIKSPQSEEQQSIVNEIKPEYMQAIKNKNFDKSFLVTILNEFISSNYNLMHKPERGVLDEKKASARLFLEKAFPLCFKTIKEKALSLTEKVTVYIVIATIVGARLGHIIFYENIFFYLSHPLSIFNLREGGLASHGAAIAIILAIILLSKRLKNFSPKIHLLSLFDLICVPATFAAICIRIGNFFNQEILGKKTDFFLGVLFLNPVDGSLPAVRHPAQLYEAFFYALFFILLLYLSFQPRFYLKRGNIFAFFLITIFSFRFFIEFIKERQGYLISGESFLQMGQYLSIPFIILGIILFIINRKKGIFS